jgi:hemoglobin-like flavoprotein
MTPDQINSIRKSFQLIQGKEEVVTLLFYNRLFLGNPNMREMFPGDIKQQAKKLAEALKLIYSSLEQLDSLRPTLRDLGSRHLREHGVVEKHYLDPGLPTQSGFLASDASRHQKFCLN